jgi:hypothetical protein
MGPIEELLKFGKFVFSLCVSVVVVILMSFWCWFYSRRRIAKAIPNPQAWLPYISRREWKRVSVIAHEVAEKNGQPPENYIVVASVDMYTLCKRGYLEKKREGEGEFSPYLFRRLR